MRSVSTAKRVRLLCTLIAVYALLMAAGGITAGVELARHQRIVAATIDPQTFVLTPQTTTYPYRWAGVAIGVGAVVVATFVLLLAEVVRMRANVVIEEGTGKRSGRSSSADGPAPTTGARRAGSTASTRRRAEAPVRRNGQRVLMLTESQKVYLAEHPPPRTDEGWYPDPFDASVLRRWNGQQWTGEQQALALPPR